MSEQKPYVIDIPPSEEERERVIRELGLHARPSEIGPLTDEGRDKSQSVQG